MTSTLHHSPMATAAGPRPPGPPGPQRLLAAATADLTEHARRTGPLPAVGGGQLIELVEAAGLSGRGGAGFPTWRKLAAVAAGPASPDRTGGSTHRSTGRSGRWASRSTGPPVVVGNGAEGEPASAKDRTLLQRGPHLVLDGLQLAAQSVSAERAYLYVPAGRTAAGVRTALAARAAAGWDRLAVEVVEAPDTFVAGEESAAVARIGGGAAIPRDKPPRVIEAGVRGRPTLVQNVETLAHLALLARYGPGWFRTQGTPDEPGTFLATVSGAVGRPGVYEVPYGVPLAGLLDLAGGGTAPLQAVLVGGYHGGWLPAHVLGTVELSRAALRPLGVSPGAGVVVALPAASCGLVETARIAAYLAGQSAGQCGPCVNGLPRLADTLTRLARGDRPAEPTAAVRRLAALVEGRGACHHPDGTARFVRSSLQVFAAEVTLHQDGRCSARPLPS